MRIINRTGNLGTAQKATIALTVASALTAIALRALGVSSKWQLIAGRAAALGLAGRLITELYGRHLDHQLTQATNIRVNYLKVRALIKRGAAVGILEKRFADEIFARAIRDNHKELVKILLKKASRRDIDEALENSLNKDIVEILLTKASQEGIDYALKKSLNEDIVKILLPEASQEAIDEALENSLNKDIVEILLTKASQKAIDEVLNTSLNKDIVKVLEEEKQRRQSNKGQPK